jgi:hypothetical protein
MKTFLADIFPKIQRFSDKLDNLTMLTNQHWVSIDDILSTKTVYIFRTNNELLISKNGKVEKAKWEHLGNKSLLIDKTTDSYLFKHGFFDENVLALKVDSSEEYAVFVNENKYDGELNSIDKVFDFLRRTYLDPSIKSTIEISTGQVLNSAISKQTVYRETQDGETLKIVSVNNETIGAKVYINEKPAKDGTYVYKSLSHKLIVKNGEIHNRYYLEPFKDFVFEKINNSEPTVGDKVYNKNWTMVPDSKIRYSLFRHFLIENSSIIK